MATHDQHGVGADAGSEKAVSSMLDTIAGKHDILAGLWTGWQVVPVWRLVHSVLRAALQTVVINAKGSYLFEWKLAERLLRTARPPDVISSWHKWLI